MSLVWGFSVIISLICFLISGNVSQVSSAFADASVAAIELIISLAGIMALWGGFMEIAEQCGITEHLSKLMSPIISRLFGSVKENKQVKSAITLNITANFLGLGNAATPLGLEAMRRMKKLSQEGETATDAMITFVIINTASVQLIPATTAMLRSRYGSSQPMIILPAVFFASIFSLAVGLILDAVIRRVKYA